VKRITSAIFIKHLGNDIVDGLLVVDLPHVHSYFGLKQTVDFLRPVQKSRDFHLLERIDDGVLDIECDEVRM
jgi:hypothetical protein